VDILVNNAGLSASQTVFESTWEIVRRLFEVNFFGNIGLAKALLPHFRQRKAGHIVVPSSVLAIVSTPTSSAYCASKQAIWGYYDSLRVEEDRHGMKVTILFPGGVKTNIFSSPLGAKKWLQVDKFPLKAFMMDVTTFVDWTLIAIANQNSTACIARNWIIFQFCYHFPNLTRWSLPSVTGSQMVESRGLAACGILEKEMQMSPSTRHMFRLTLEENKDD
ncbi:unnamed protein product, partial [Darwinula stevensoni]